MIRTSFFIVVISTCASSYLSQAFTIAAGSLKLNGRQHSPAAARYIADAISAKRDDMIVWFETDTTLTNALWSDIAVHVASKGYNCNALPGRSPARPYYGIGLNGPKHGVHALLICTQRSVLERNHSAHPRACWHISAETQQSRAFTNSVYSCWWSRDWPCSDRSWFGHSRCC